MGGVQKRRHIRPGGDLSPPNALGGCPVPEEGGPPSCSGQGFAPSPPRGGTGEPTPTTPTEAPSAASLTRRGLGPRALPSSSSSVCPSSSSSPAAAAAPRGTSGRGERRRGPAAAAAAAGGARGGGDARGLGCGRGEGAGARGPAGARPGAREGGGGEGWRLHAPALRQSPAAAAAAKKAVAPRSLRNAAAPHNHGVRGHGSGLCFPALLRGQDPTGGGAGRRESAFPSAPGCMRVCRGVCVSVCEE